MILSERFRFPSVIMSNKNKYVLYFTETNDTDDRDDQRHDTKKNCCNLGNKRKCRKLTFTCQSQDKVYDKVHGDNLLSTLTRTGQRTEEVPSKILSTVDEKDAHSPGIACDIIEHI